MLSFRELMQCLFLSLQPYHLIHHVDSIMKLAEPLTCPPNFPCLSYTLDPGNGPLFLSSKLPVRCQRAKAEHGDMSESGRERGRLRAGNQRIPLGLEDNPIVGGYFTYASFLFLNFYFLVSHQYQAPTSREVDEHLLHG